MIEHLPLQRRHVAVARPRCEAIRTFAARASTGDQLIAASRPEVELARPLNVGPRPQGWVENVDPPGTVTPTDAGRDAVRPAHRRRPLPGLDQGKLRSPNGRLHRRTQGGRGRPDQHARTVGAGRRGAACRRACIESGSSAPDGSVAPGDGWRGRSARWRSSVSTLQRLTTVRPERATRLCGRDWDWIELVRP